MKPHPHHLTPHDIEDAAAGHWHDEHLTRLAWLARFEGLGHRVVTVAVLAAAAFVTVGLATGWL